MDDIFIKLSANGIKLDIIDAPEIVSNLQGIVYAQFLLSGYDGYAVSALFWRGDNAYNQIIGSDGRCAVPAELLAKPGQISIGLIAICEGKTITTKVPVSVRVGEGAYRDSRIPAPPTPSIYEQVMASLAEAGPAADAAARSAGVAADSAAGAAADRATVAADKAAVASDKAAAEAAVGKTSYIGANGNWYQWDAAAGAFADSGVHAQGAQGAQGMQGIQGERGETGAPGAQGAQGIQGERGETGAPGAQGIQGEQGMQGAQGIQGEQGEHGATFTPSVSAAGVLSWTNDGSKPNPAPVNMVDAVIAALPNGDGVSY